MGGARKAIGFFAIALLFFSTTAFWFGFDVQSTSRSQIQSLVNDKNARMDSDGKGDQTASDRVVPICPKSTASVQVNTALKVQETHSKSLSRIREAARRARHSVRRTVIIQADGDDQDERVEVPVLGCNEVGYRCYDVFDRAKDARRQFPPVGFEEQELDGVEP